MQAKAIITVTMTMALACKLQNWFKAAAQKRGCPMIKQSGNYSPV